MGARIIPVQPLIQPLVQCLVQPLVQCLVRCLERGPSPPEIWENSWVWGGAPQKK
jgi:hypothetical protein